jgi:hypothetical protein
VSLPDPTGRLITEIRDTTGEARVRGGEPAPGDALGPGHYQRFVVLVRLARTRLPHAPTQGVTYAARCYGVTHQDAAALAGQVADAVHDRGHRITPGGLSIFGSFDDGGGGSATDPDTGQPYEVVLFSVGALDRLLPMA